MPSFHDLSEGLARKTSRRNALGRSAELVFGALAGIAAGSLARASGVAANDRPTYCAFPGPPCACDKCQSSGICAKPCIILTTFYPSGCWTTSTQAKGTVTCCDCDCHGIGGTGWCGCGSDYHNNPTYCPHS